VGYEPDRFSAQKTGRERGKARRDRVASSLHRESFTTFNYAKRIRIQRGISRKG
jgi:hypothetical protein